MKADILSRIIEQTVITEDILSIHCEHIQTQMENLRSIKGIDNSGEQFMCVYQHPSKPIVAKIL